jgi:hypothetical protein
MSTAKSELIGNQVESSLTNPESPYIWSINKHPEGFISQQEIINFIQETNPDKKLDEVPGLEISGLIVAKTEEQVDRKIGEEPTDIPVLEVKAPEISAENLPATVKFIDAAIDYMNARFYRELNGERIGPDVLLDVSQSKTATLNSKVVLDNAKKLFDKAQILGILQHPTQLFGQPFNIAAQLTDGRLTTGEERTDLLKYLTHNDITPINWEESARDK